MALRTIEGLMRTRAIWMLVVQVVAVAFAAHGQVAQVFVGSGHDPRFEALNAVLRFRTDLRGRSTVIAACRLFDVRSDTAQSKALDSHFRSLLVLPATKDSERVAKCAPIEFARMGKQVLWLDRIVATAPNGDLRPTYRTPEYQITFQVFADGGYKEYQRYLVGPIGNNSW